MTSPTDPATSSYPIATLKEMLSDRVKLDLSDIELAEILWLAVQRSEGVPPVELPIDLPEEIPDEVSLNDNPPIVPSTSGERQPDVKADIVVDSPKSEEGEKKAETPLPIAIPEAVALRNRREISKALRPLMRKVPSRLRKAIDEEATAMRIAEDKIWSPVVKPEPDRWLELAIVIEVTNVFDVWRDMIAEFQHLMERHGAFRDVRTWQLQTSGHSLPQLFLQTAKGLSCKPRSPRELLDAGGRRLILFLSDCTSSAWRSGKIFDLLQLWSRENPVTIAQLLPENLWDRSALRLGSLVALRSQLAGALSRDWNVEGLSLQRRKRLRGGLKLPVVTIQPQSLGMWARATAAACEQQTTGIVLRSDAFKVNKSTDVTLEPLTAKQLVQRFRGTASDKAQDLADMMAVLPVNWSVLKLLQKNLVQKSSETLQEPVALYLAEIFLSGLLRPIENAAGQAQKRSQQYDFVEGVRHVLLGAIPISEGRDVGEEIAKEIFKQLPKDVQERVNADIARRQGESLSYFEAFLMPDLPWGEEATAEMLPFAQVTGDVLRRWGGKYAELAAELEQKYVPIPPDLKNCEGLSEGEILIKPHLLDFEFDIAEIVFEEELPRLKLESFKYQIGTIAVIKSSNLFTDLRFLEQEGQGIQFVEVLDKYIQLEMVEIPTGNFIMGAAREEIGSSDRERPQHNVNIERFFLGKYAITQAQYAAIMGNNPSHFKNERDSPNHPVEQVSWSDATEFCRRLSEQTGKEYRLPSEAEWEYACRGMTSPPTPLLKGEGSKKIYPPFHFGETIDASVANYNASSSYGRGLEGEYRAKTTPVGSFKVANAFGLYDMHGNVWEWCEDTWHDNYEGAPTDGSAWIELDKTLHLLRGGSWNNYPLNCRSASRFNNDTVIRNGIIGFRVACSARGLL